jgi:ribosomal protein RSM22 (predicted rRNA methylase)
VREVRREEVEAQDDPPPPPPLPFEEGADGEVVENSGERGEYKEGIDAFIRSGIEEEGAEGKDSPEPEGTRASPSEMARAARNFFGDSLPQGALSEEEFVIYKRMYGEPSAITTDHLVEDAEGEGDILLRDNEDGTVDEFQYVQEPLGNQIVDEDADLEEEEDLKELDEPPDDMALLERQVTELSLQKDLQDQEGTEISLTFGEIPAEEDEDVPKSHSKDEILDEIYDNWPGDDNFVRSHPFTSAGKFGTKPSTLQLPRDAFVTPVQALLSGISNKHLSEAAQKSLGGVGIPDSPSTPAIGRSKGQRPVPLTALQGKMNPMEAGVFISSVMPQVYASTVSVLVECRKRMGSVWLRGLMEKDGGKGPLVLDVGGGGAGIVAWREVVRAEWEAMREEENGIQSPRKKEERVPVGRATVVTGSDSLRFKASALLENTTFIPRLPDHVDSAETETNLHQPRKRYDIIIAPHTLWPLVEDYERKSRTQTLWSLLNPNGGLLILLEKGVPRGFEVIAGARDLLLNRHVSSPGAETYENTLEEQGTTAKESRRERYTAKEKGSIIAPCTNHRECPLYPVPGVSKGRKDWCYFQQRYTRPSFLMSVLQAKARNHDDVEFSYLAVQRGVDIREQQGIRQGEEGTEKARVGYGPRRERRDEDEEAEDIPAVAEEEPPEVVDAEQEPPPHPLTLPRILPGPLKRKGHILLDVCTPSGTYERWMVRRGLGKQAFRDARKAKWGDLWALGASSSEARRIKVGTPVQVVNMANKRARERAKGWRKGREGGRGKWRFDGGKSVEEVG